MGTAPRAAALADYQQTTLAELAKSMAMRPKVLMLDEVNAGPEAAGLLGPHVALELLAVADELGVATRLHSHPGNEGDLRHHRSPSSAACHDGSTALVLKETVTTVFFWVTRLEYRACARGSE